MLQFIDTLKSRRKEEIEMLKMYKAHPEIRELISVIKDLPADKGVELVKQVLKIIKMVKEG